MSSWERHVEDQERAAMGEWLRRVIDEAKDIWPDPVTFKVALLEAVEIFWEVDE